MMHMKYIHILLIACCCVGIGGCKKFLGTRPNDFLSPVNYYSNEEQLKFALAGVYSNLAKSETYGDRMLGRMGLDADEGFYSRSGELTGVSVYDVSATDPIITSWWRFVYEGINRANLLLANVKKPAMDEKKRNAIEGEALFLRGYYYLLLVSNFGGVPLILEPVGSANAVNFPRATAKEVYDQVVADMTAAEGLVLTASEAGHGGRISKSAVRGMLARVSLYMAGHPINDATKYAAAREWALKVMQPQDDGFQHALNPSFEGVFMNYCQDKYDIKESIWELEFWGNTQGAYRETGRVGSNNGIAYSTDPPDPKFAYSYGFLNPTGKLFRSFEAGDLRRDWTIAPYRTAGNPAVKTNWTASQIYERNSGKWRREHEVVMPKDKNGGAINFPLLRYSDVLLMFAEAENEVNGPTGEAYEALNQVRRRAFGKPANTPDAADITGLDKESFRQFIQEERSRELAFECLRKRDLVRWNIFLPVMKAVANQIDGEAPSAFKYAARSYTNASARDELWPIPARELGLNKALTQNPGW